MTSQAAYAVEQIIDHGDNSVIQQDISNYETIGDQNEMMKALTWQGKGKVEISNRPKLHP